MSEVDAGAEGRHAVGGSTLLRLRIACMTPVCSSGLWLRWGIWPTKHWMMHCRYVSYFRADGQRLRSTEVHCQAIYLLAKVARSPEWRLAWQANIWEPSTLHKNHLFRPTASAYADHRNNGFRTPVRTDARQVESTFRSPSAARAHAGHWLHHRRACTTSEPIQDAYSCN